jgi:hypothetical protein
MDSYVIAFIRSSLVWLALGVTLGLWLVFDPQAIVYRAAHMHANLLGFVSMMIFGVAYHVIPRFSGRPLFSARSARIHVWLANIGLAGMVSGFMLRVWQAGAGSLVLRAGAIASALGVAFFITNIWKTVGPTGVISLTASPSMKPQRR